MRAANFSFVSCFLVFFAVRFWHVGLMVFGRVLF